jgi:L-aspartate oxidase
MLEEIRKEVAAKAEGQHEYYIEAAKRLICVAKLIMEPALMRKESRGGHYREDYPCSDEAFVLHSVQQKGKEIATAPVNAGYFEF